MLVAGPDDREVIRQTIGQIRELYKEIVQMRIEDRAKYRDMCARLEILERDRSSRLKKHRRLAKQQERLRRKKEKAAAKIGTPAGACPGSLPKKTPSKVDSASHDGTSKTDENGPNEE
ncbi:Protein CBG20650 [Caenorhabditis briggsae]|uniref:Protein CBG20650 n=1 Tax=Caenorhabditis briggsae TaxID=6238 RepID=A8XYA7_CAEBR|nr:Protein CBG20650 [Caenorhabditis briggsae]CAP37624.1 Protein CBG20650 [Caenorhabditis briggsae]